MQRSTRCCDSGAFLRLMAGVLPQKVDADSEPRRRGHRPGALKVAMTFPARKASKKRPASEPLPRPPTLDSDEEEVENFMSKRALNIKENKEMVHRVSLLCFPLRCRDTRPARLDPSIHFCFFLFFFFSSQSSWQS